MYILLALLLFSTAPWTRSTQTLHGGEIVMSAMARSGAVIDFYVRCNTVPPCLPIAPHDQFGNFFKLVSRSVTRVYTREHFSMKVPPNLGIEIISTGTNEIGRKIDYLVEMDTQ